MLSALLKPLSNLNKVPAALNFNSDFDQSTSSEKTMNLFLVFSRIEVIT
jgi:hypothetical protein